MSHREDFFFALERAVNMSMKKRSIDIPSDKGVQALNELADRATTAHFRQRNLLFLEATISSMLDTWSPFEVADILREQADQLVEYI